MTDHMYSAEEAAQILGLQVRTVRNYVRDGSLPGVRIGKQYRIAPVDLEAFTAGAQARAALGEAQLELSAPRQPTVSAQASTVVQIDGIAGDARETLERTLEAATAAGQTVGARLRVEPLYDEPRQRLKLIIVGSVGETAELLRLIDLFAIERD